MHARWVDIRPLRVDGMPLASEPPDGPRVHRAILRVLEETPLCAWSTVLPDGTAHVNIGYFAYAEELQLYLLSHPGSLHCRNLLSNPTMAVAVFASTQKWTDPGRGIQLFGRCEAIAGPEASEKAERTYGRRYPAYAAWKASRTPGDPALDYRFYAFVPERVKILDESEFGDAVLIQAHIVRE